MVRAYFASEHRDDRQLVAYGLRLGNQTVFKRLGFLMNFLQHKMGIPAFFGFFHIPVQNVYFRPLKVIFKRPDFYSVRSNPGNLSIFKINHIFSKR